MAREQMHFSADNDTKEKILALAKHELRKKSDMASVLIAEALEARQLKGFAFTEEKAGFKVSKKK